MAQPWRDGNPLQAALSHARISCREEKIREKDNED
jgi:hypothetical protein